MCVKVLPSLEENEAFPSANDGLKDIQMVECDSNSFHIEPVQAGQIILTSQVIMLGQNDFCMQ